MSTDSQPIPPPGQVRLITLFSSIIFPMFMGMIGETIVATALPAIAASLGGVERIAWVVVAYLIMLAVMAPVYGRLGDAFGRRRMMVVALVISLVGSVLCAVSTTIEMLIASRTIQGLGGGGLISLAHALVGQSVPPRDRARFHGHIAAVGFGASALGPVIGGFLTEHFGWPSVFLVNLPLGFMALALVFRLPARVAPFAPFRFDLPGLVLFAVFIWALLVFVETARRPASASLVLAAGLLAGAILSLLALLRWERRAADPLFPRAIMVNPTIWRSNAIAVFHGGYFVAILSFTPIYLSVVREQSVTEIGLLMLPITFGVGLGAFATGQIVARTGRAAIFPSLGLTVVSALIAVLGFGAEAMSTVAFSCYLGVAALFMGTVMGVVQVTVQSEAGMVLLGTATGMISLARALGGAVGTALVGATLFAIMAANGVEISTELQAILQGGGDDLAGLGRAPAAAIRAEVAFAFRGVFLLIAAYAAIGCVLAWTLPRRTI